MVSDEKPRTSSIASVICPRGYRSICCTLPPKIGDKTGSNPGLLFSKPNTTRPSCGLTSVWHLAYPWGGVRSTSSAAALAGFRFKLPAGAYPCAPGCWGPGTATLSRITPQPDLFFRPGTLSSRPTYSAKPGSSILISNERSKRKDELMPDPTWRNQPDGARPYPTQGDAVEVTGGDVASTAIALANEMKPMTHAPHLPCLHVHQSCRLGGGDVVTGRVGQFRAVKVEPLL